MADDLVATTLREKRLRVLIWGASDQYNHFDRILAANIQQWGYEASILPAGFANGFAGQDGGDVIKADVLVCDLDSLFRTPLPLAVNGQSAFLPVAKDHDHLPAVSLARLVIGLSSRSVSRSTLEQLGAVALLYKPFEMSLLQRYLVVMQQLLLSEEPFEAAPEWEEHCIANDGDGSVRVLVVDDHAEVARTIRQCLECEPEYDVRIAKDGLEALEQCVSWQPQCIVTDLLMPWMNGYQVMRSLSASRSWYGPVFVVLSALPRRELSLQPDYLRGKEIVFVEKPFQVEQLLQAVKQAMAQ
jgi:CheY-like chemotaxis protein